MNFVRGGLWVDDLCPHDSIQLVSCPGVWRPNRSVSSRLLQSPAPKCRNLFASTALWEINFFSFFLLKQVHYHYHISKYFFMWLFLDLLTIDRHSYKSCSLSSHFQRQPTAISVVHLSVTVCHYRQNAKTSDIFWLCYEIATYTS